MLKKYFLILDVVLVIIALIIVVDISFSFARAGKIPVTKPPVLPPGKEEVKEKEKEKEKSRPYEHYSIIVDRNLFAGGVEAETEEYFEESLPETALNLELKGTIVVEGLESLCIIEDPKTKKEEVYKKGDLVGENEVVNIRRDQVVLRTSSGLVSLVVYEGASLPPISTDTTDLVRKAASNRWSLSRSELTSVISNPNQLLAQVKVTPYLEAGQVRGFRLDDVKRGSLAESLGVKDGDIIKGVEDQRLESIEGAIQIYKEVKDKPVISVEIERNGRPVTLTYEIMD